MITNKEKLKSLLKEKGIKPTYQRLKILEYMSKNLNNHPTVEMVYDKLLQDIPTLSLTTVYNTLNNFLEKRLVYGVTITGTEVRYDFNTDYHHHFLCKKCGQIYDVDLKCAYAEGTNGVISDTSRGSVRIVQRVRGKKLEVEGLLDGWVIINKNK
jgi:Fur family peroxide stress response transcriptional regulator